MRTRIYTLLLCCLGSVLLVTVMSYLSDPEHHIGSGFIRVVPSKKIQGIGFVPVTGPLRYFAGGDSTQIYLGNWAKPAELLKLKLPAMRLDTIRMQANLKGLMQGVYADILQEQVFLMDGIGGSYSTADTTAGVFGKRKSLPRFSASVPMGDDRFILRVIRDSLVNSLVKVAAGTTGKPLILDGKANSIFATDGTLCATPDGSLIFYNYYYKNQFLCLDSNLNLLYTGKTIDTCSVAQVKVARVASDKSLQMAAPPRRVNVRAAVSENWLFVQSAIKAENETEASVKGVSVIDVYAARDGKYKFSLYVPDFKEEKLRDFRVYGRYLAALYKSCVYVYELKF